MASSQNQVPTSDKKCAIALNGAATAQTGTADASLKWSESVDWIVRLDLERVRRNVSDEGDPLDEEVVYGSGRNRRQVQGRRVEGRTSRRF